MGAPASFGGSRDFNVTAKLDHLAVIKADKEFYAAHPELHGRKLTGATADGPLRQEWRRIYSKTAKSHAKPLQPRIIPKNTTAKVISLNAVQPCLYAKINQSIDFNASTYSTNFYIANSTPQITSIPSKSLPETFTGWLSIDLQQQPLPTDQITKVNILPVIVAELSDLPSLAIDYLVDKLKSSLVQSALEIVVNQGAIASDVKKIIDQVRLSLGLGKLGSKPTFSSLSNSILFGIIANIAGHLAFLIAKKNGASDWVAEFDKQLLISVVTGVTEGPQAQMMQTVVGVIESGSALVFENVEHFNQALNSYTQIADSANVQAQRALARGDRVAYERMLIIDSDARRAIANLYIDNPIIATMSEIPNKFR